MFLVLPIWAWFLFDLRSNYVPPLISKPLYTPLFTDCIGSIFDNWDVKMGQF